MKLRRTGLYNVVQSPTKWYKIVQSCTASYRVVQHRTGSYIVVQSHTKWYKIAQCGTASYRVVKRRTGSYSVAQSYKVGLCDNSNNATITIRKLISCYRYWLHYLSIIGNNCIAQYISALGDV